MANKMINTGNLSEFEVLTAVLQTIAFLLTAVFTACLVWLANDVKRAVKLSEELRRLHRIRDLAREFYTAGIGSDKETKRLIEPELTHLALRVDKPTQLKADINHLSQQLDEPSLSDRTDSPAYQSLQKVYKRVDELEQERFEKA